MFSLLGVKYDRRLELRLTKVDLRVGRSGEGRGAIARWLSKLRLRLVNIVSILRVTSKSPTPTVQ